LIPLAPIGVRLGFYLLHKVRTELIYRICYSFLFIAGGYLFTEGVRGVTS
jgi:hypothetical protein